MSGLNLAFQPETAGYKRRQREDSAQKLYFELLDRGLQVPEANAVAKSFLDTGSINVPTEREKIGYNPLPAGVEGPLQQVRTREPITMLQKEPTSLEKILASQVRGGNISLDKAFEMKQPAQPSYVTPVVNESGQIEYSPVPKGTKPTAPVKITPKKTDEGLTEAQKAVDKDFAKEYSDFVLGGGYADVQKQIGQLNGVATALEKSSGITGPLVGLIPRGGREIMNPTSASMQDAVEEVVQRNLRSVLGAQFTENEGNRLIARAYNPKLPQEENSKRLKRLIGQIDEAAKAKAEAGQYLEQNGTLKGFKGKLYRSANDFLSDEKKTKGKNEIQTITNDADFERLPSGTVFLDPEGVQHTKK